MSHDRTQQDDEMRSAINAYRAFVEEGDWEQAARFYRRELSVPLLDTFADYDTAIELLVPLFSDGMNRLPGIADPFLRGYIANEMEMALFYVGRKEESLALNGLLIRHTIDQDDQQSLRQRLHNYASSLRGDNRLKLAERAAEASLDLAATPSLARQAALSRLFLFMLYVDTGRWHLAQDAYGELRQQTLDDFWASDVQRHYARMLIARGEPADAVLDDAQRLAEASQHALGIRTLKTWRGESLVLAGDYTRAAQWFEESLALHQQSGADADDVSGGLARVYALLGDHTRARTIIEGTVFTSRHLVNAAEVYHLLGERAKAREVAVRAYEAAWADGPPHAWWWSLERAKHVLDAVGEPYPVLPPFDETRVGKYACQDAVEAYIALKTRE